MQFESFEKLDVKISETDTAKRLSNLHKGFESRFTDAYKNYLSVSETAQEGLAAWIGENAALTADTLPETMDAIKEMYDASRLDGYEKYRKLCLKEIQEWKVHPDYEYQCNKQHAGYAAEVISTVKENLIAKIEGTGITTVRADDLPDSFPKNDQYVDKVRIDASGNIIERIQTKFVGKDAKECLAKLKSSGFDKYFMEDKVDKVEIPKDYYDDVKSLIKEQRAGLEKQIEYLKNAEGKDDVLLRKQKLVERLDAVDRKIEKSTVTSEEALEAVKNPEKFMKQLMAKDIVANANKVGLESGMAAAGLSAFASSIDNVQKYLNGEVTALEAVEDIAKDTGIAGAVGYGTGFVSTTVANTMASSSHELISKVGGSCAPAAVVAWGVQSFDAVVDFSQGEITKEELAYEFGKNAANVAGGIVAGAAVGSVVPGAGTAVGAGAGFVASMVGCALASEAYAAAVEHGGEGVDIMASKAQELASKTVEMAKTEVPEKVSFIRKSINGFASENNIPIKV